MNKEKIISVLEKQDGLRLGNLCGCAVGVLLSEVGYTKSRGVDLCPWLGFHTDRKLSSRTKEYWARKRLREAYDLTDEEIHTLMRENDRYLGSSVGRRDHVIERVKNYQGVES